jgi:hypothetical protein
MNDLLEKFVKRGSQIVNALEIDETVSGKSGKHSSHRFSDGTYLFPRTQGFPKTRVARVDWTRD